MRIWQAASLVEHPGHSPQSVHGHRGGDLKSAHVVHSITKTPRGYDAKHAATTVVRANRGKTYTKISNASVGRLARLLSKTKLKPSIHSDERVSMVSYT